jgi:hypothetical protein
MYEQYVKKNAKIKLNRLTKINKQKIKQIKLGLTRQISSGVAILS